LRGFGASTRRHRNRRRDRGGTRFQDLFDLHTPVYKVLFDVSNRQLDFEIIRVVSGDFFETEKDRLEPGQIVDFVDLLVQTLQLCLGIRVLRSHDAILH
jgi:hypothetical protein